MGGPRVAAMANTVLSGSVRSPAASPGPRDSRARVVLDWAASSDAGTCRNHNEDSWRVLEEHGLMVLADGMGGYSAGEVASAIAVDGVCAHVSDDPGAGAAADPCAELRRAISAANAAILAAAARRPECLGMGTTLVAAWVVGRRLHHAHVGDSRAYLLREGVLLRLTSDHSMRQAMVDAGVVGADSTRRAAFRGVLTRALGVESLVQADAGTVELEPGDRLLLCSDGLTDLVDDARIRAVLAGPDGCAAQARQLVAHALEAGGHDNVTAIVARPADAEASLLLGRA